MAAGFRDLLRLLFWFWPGDSVPAAGPFTQTWFWRADMDISPTFHGSTNNSVSWGGSTENADAWTGEL